jgi:molybdopterin-guanine dinucleotide biosynthesis protein A
LPLAAVILAGGASRRMGRDKATTLYEGKPLVEHVVAAVRTRCNPVIVVAAPGQPLPELDADIVRDELPGVGPLLATGRGLRAAAEAGRDRAFVCGVDMPLLTADLIDTLAGPAVVLDADIVLPWDGRTHYLAGIYRTSLHTRVAELIDAGKRSMRDLVRASDTHQVVMPKQVALTNVNTVDELHSLPPLRIA